MPHAIEYSPIIDEIRNILKASQSVLLHAPRYFGKRKLLERISHEHIASDGVVIEILTDVALPATQLDLKSIWKSAARALGAKAGAEIETIFDFEMCFLDALEPLKRPLLVLIGGEGRWNDENHFTVVSAFNRILQNVGLRGRSMLSVVATDDYSMFHSRKKPFESALAFFEKVHCPPLAGSYIMSAVSASAELDGVELPVAFAHELSSWIEHASGGHIGIVDVLLRDLSEKKWKTGPSHNATADARVLRSHVILGLRRMLKEDIYRCSRIALEYREPKSRGAIDPRVDFLVQLGILQWHRTYDTLKLCPGIISAMLQEMFEHSKSEELVRRSGPVAVRNTFDAPLDPPAVDDIVVVHISDLHISRNSHRFRLRWKNNWETADLNSGTQSLVQLLFEDLQSLNLVGLVDALVISGDVVERGTDEEFENAEVVIRELLSALRIPEKRLSLIAGNHDVLWPDADNPTRDVSRVPYEKFAKKFGRSALDASLMTVISQSGKSQLRILELDSNRVEGPDASGIGFVSDDALVEAARLLNLKSPKKKGKEVVNRYTWMSVHHHVFPATPLPIDQAKKAKVSVLGNATELLNLANRSKVELVLHGHEHQPSVTVARRWSIDKGYQLAPITTVGAGSFGAATKLLGPISRNQYHIIYRRPQEIVIRSRVLGDSGNLFERHQDITLDERFLFGVEV